MGILRRLLGTGAPASLAKSPDRDERFKAGCEAIERSGLPDKQKRTALERLAASYLDGKEPLVKESGRFGLGPHVKPGHVAVVTDRGKPRRGAYGPGVVSGLPGFTEAEQYSVRAQRYDFSLRVLSARRLPLTIELTVQHQLDAGGVRAMFDNVGPDYARVLMEPFLTRSAQRIAFQRKEEDLMDPAFADELTGLLCHELQDAGIAVKITLRSVQPATVVTQAYEARAAAEFAVMTLDAEKQRLAAEMDLLGLKTRLAIMQAAMDGRVRITQAELDAAAQRVVQQVQIDLDAQRQTRLGQVDIDLTRERGHADIDVSTRRVRDMGAAEADARRQQLDVDAERVQRVSRAEMEVDRARRQPDFLTPEYFRELLIQKGGAAMGADAVGHAAQTLAEGVAGLFGKKK